MLTPSEEAKIILWNAGLGKAIDMKLIATDDRRSEVLRDFCLEMAKLATNVTIAEERGVAGTLPALQVARNVRYVAVPTGLELEPFLQAVAGANGSAAVRESISSLGVPARLKLYVARECPSCPAMVREVVPLATANELVGLEIIDAFLFPEAARKDDVQSVPALFMDDVFRWTGAVTLDEIVAMLVSRDPSTFSAEVFERMLEEGGATGVARMILRTGEIFPAFLELLIDEKFRTRLGAMTAMEEVTRVNMGLAARAVDPLWERFGEVIEPIQIDLLYFLGDVGTEDKVPLLESVISGAYRDHVKEAAREAIQRIRQRAK